MYDEPTQPLRRTHAETLTNRAVIIPQHSAQPVVIRATSFSIIFLAVISALICWTGILFIIAALLLRSWMPTQPIPEPPTKKDNTSCASSCSPSVLV